jgi:tRNA-2-methylthio-N6-dimethylallyladenosine synthase
MKKAHIHTFGCQMNVHDSEKMAGILKEKGYDLTDDRKEADLIIFNTCSIRQKAEQKFLSELGRLKTAKARRPSLKVAVAGCIAQQMGGELFKRAPHVDYVFGPQNIHSLKDILEHDDGMAVDQNPDIDYMELKALRKEKHRAWVSIMYGCNNFCSYCIVPYTRGRETSRPSKNVVEEIKKLAGEGTKEVTLLGQNVNSYRSDTDFPGLLKMINSIDGIERIRFVTSHPRDLSSALIDAMATLDKVCSHIHLPMQSGADRVLKKMNREYTYEEYREKVDSLRRRVPGISITSDFIAGFPTEAEEEHKETIRALHELRLDGVFAFIYSQRPGTAATLMEGQLEEQIKLNRLKEILAVQDGITLDINKALEGSIQEVLVEGKNESGQLTGRTTTNKIVNISTWEGELDELTGCLVPVTIIEARRHSLLGEIATVRAMVINKVSTQESHNR